MEKNSVAVTNEKVRTYIPEEISISILSKLPIKSLKRFECVQKSWSLLFENHHFMNMFLNKFLSYSDQACHILRAVENRKGVFYSFSGERFDNKVKLDWSNTFRNNNVYPTGIFGFGCVSGTLCLYEHRSSIVLWNPATQTIKCLPPSEAELTALAMKYESEAYDLSVRYYLHGFGYDHTINDYKVIRYVNVNVYENLIRKYVEVRSLEDGVGGTIFYPLWEIYSLRSRSWRKLYVDMPYSLKYDEGTQVYMDGVCYWLCEDYKTVGPCLVSFYLNNEEFFITPIPSDVDDCFDTKASWINLAVLNESIALISYHTETTTFHISILSEFGMKESWTKLLIVGPLSCVERPIKVGAKGEIFFIRKDEELVWLDLTTQMIGELGYKREPYTRLRIIIYKDGILPIEGISN